MKLDSLTEVLLLVVNNKNVENYLELGVEHGFNFCDVSKKCKKSVGVDIINSLKSELPENAEFFLGTTDDFFAQNKNFFDLILIDAGHSHENSLRDFLNSINFLSKDGIILMHDTYPLDESYTDSSLCGEVYKTVLHIKENFYNDFEFFTFPFHPGITILKKINRKKQVSWQ